ncbi:hypothetical protein [Phosphitispora fastidiosa]
MTDEHRLIYSIDGVISYH